ncbi:SoxR reducing system RseC family protein [Paramaledivibacter caminithermalis]|jgi:sigma-E factor negative regulatory protein RseC|uniref:Positive regulator of sigma(E), RseC/MucC n=1 Tax=Paramaledivibacter caminithermalis (strain DSM 15212 / CIP 107654 / DViRD3) TaxID=1121301 RepID=A0A1M6JW60_PARC5|nr:SoxR reducing system RseC family protein [Paramaledivibacter caminithermalis]SHJ50879.1 positive regulator of sigma(E), RseC/MucC [Paramaledivibacter caminithermalis DSM 15212]
MKREGKVIAVNEKNATVKLMRHSACGDCGACQMGKENMNIEIEALNTVGADIGDKVMVDMTTQDVLTAAFIAYGIPLIMLIIGIVGGKFILELLGMKENIELFAFVLGLVLMTITFFNIKKRDKKFKESKKYLSEITEIID